MCPSAACKYEVWTSAPFLTNQITEGRVSIEVRFVLRGHHIVQHLFGDNFRLQRVPAQQKLRGSVKCKQISNFVSTSIFYQFLSVANYLLGVSQFSENFGKTRQLVGHLKRGSGLELIIDTVNERIDEFKINATHTFRELGKWKIMSQFQSGNICWWKSAENYGVFPSRSYFPVKTSVSACDIVFRRLLPIPKPPSNRPKTEWSQSRKF